MNTIHTGHNALAAAVEFYAASLRTLAAELQAAQAKIAELQAQLDAKTEKKAEEP